MRLLCILLVLCFIGTAFIGCGKKKGGDAAGENGEGGADGTTATEKPTNEYGEPSFTSNLPKGDLDFDGAEVAILFRDFIHNSREWKKETTEDELDEAIAMRNEAVQEELNVKIVWQPVASNGNDYTEYTARFHDMVINDVNSGRHYYDISANFGYPTTSNNIRDYTTNLLDTSLFPYFNFELPCWNQAIVNNTTFNDQLYYVAGDINLSMFDAACVVWHNKTLYDANKLASDPDSLQKHALNGNWIYDDLHRWTSAFYVDNGTSPDARDSSDTYALLAASYSSAPMPRDVFPYAWDLQFVVENNDGTHSFNIVGNSKIDTALSNARKLLRGSGTYSSSNANMFASGRAIFYMERLYSGHDANMAIREMEDTYALLPMPKYDTKQTQYATTSQDYYTLMFVLDHSYSKVPTKGEEISAFLQLSTEIYYLGIRGYYFETVVMPRSSKTSEKSEEIFRLIIDGIKFDYCYVYSQQLNNINHLWRNALGEGSTDTIEKMYLNDKSDFEEAVMATDKWFGLG